MAGLQQRAGVDVLHHVLIDAVDEVARGALPQTHILAVAAQHHITTHQQQGMLAAQARLQLSLGISSDGKQAAVAVGKLSLRGIVPSVLLCFAGTLQILLQLPDVAHHQRIALPLC